MTNKRIFEKMIKKVIKNGWDMFGNLKESVVIKWKVKELTCMEDKHKIETNSEIPYGLQMYINNHRWKTIVKLEEIIFDPDFAKALWGIKLLDEGCKHFKENQCKYIWQSHLQQLVLEKDYLKYIEKNCEL